MLQVAQDKNLLAEEKLTTGCGSSCWLTLDSRRCRTHKVVAVAPSQILLALAVRVVGEAGDGTLAVPDEEGASPGGDEGGAL